jgi:hypothetical protein
LVDEQGSENSNPSASRRGRPSLEFEATNLGRHGVSDWRLDHLRRFGLKVELFEEGGNL